MGPPKCGAPGNCPVCPPLKPALRVVEPYRYTNINSSEKVDGA